VIAGSVEISYKPYDGDPITVAHIEKGGWFGWSAAVGSKYYTSSAVAIEPLKAVRVRGSDFRRFCLENPEAGKDVLGHLAKSVSGRWKHANDQVLSILTQGMRES
jgi:CRP-like cAMP-binding protein